jgi:ribosomal protein S8
MNKHLLILINNIKLAYKYKKLVVLVPNNKYSIVFINLLCVEGYIKSYYLFNNKNILIYLSNKNYKSLNNNIINNIKIISKPSRKISTSYDHLKKIKRYKSLNNFTILSNNLGLLSKEKALELKQGGELLFIIN